MKTNTFSSKLAQQVVIGLSLAVFLFPAATWAENPKDGSSSEVDSDSGFAYIRGKEHLLQGEFDKALPYLEKALKADPNSAVINGQLAEVHLRLRNIEQAEVYGKKAVEAEPTNLEYRSNLAGILATLKKYPEAKEQYAKIVELEPTNTKAPLLMGILEAEGGQVDKGIEVLNKLIQESPENFMALFYRARMYLEQENIEKAKADLDRALTLRPSFTEAGAALGLIYEKLNNPDEAIKVYSRIQGSGPFKKRLAQLYLQNNQTDKALQELLEYEKSEPDDYTARVKIGLIYFEKKDYSNARAVFEKVLKEEPEADNVRFYNAWVLEEMKQFGDAIKEFKKVTRDSNLFKESSLHIGFIFREQKKYQEGLEFAKKLIDKEPKVEEYHDLYASFLEGKKEYKKAIAAVQTALKLFPNSEKLGYFEGVLHDKLGNKRAAIESMKKIIDLNPSNYHALNFVGYTYADLGENLSQAEDYVRKAMSLKPNDGFIEDSLGWVLFKQGKIKESQEALERAAALQPEEAIILEHLGDVYQSQKEFSKAREFYKKAVSLSSSKDKEMAKKIESKIAGLPIDKNDAPDKRVPTSK